jgi:hypothetical protein
LGPDVNFAARLWQNFQKTPENQGDAKKMRQKPHSNDTKCAFLALSYRANSSTFALKARSCEQKTSI